MLEREQVLVTGGSGYFGSILVKHLSELGKRIRVLDLYEPAIPVKGVEYITGDICNIDICLKATEDISSVYHNVALVPLAKNSRRIYKINVLGTKNICEASKINSVKNFIFTSSSAVYGIPTELPITLDSRKFPMESYGKTKLIGESLVKDLNYHGLNVKIIRPRTILGHGRLGIFGLLFSWIHKGINIFTLGEGSYQYQFIHADDLATGIIKASQILGYREFNLGALEFKSLKEDLQGLCDYSKSGSQVISLNNSFIRPLLRLASILRILPFASYQLNLYSKEIYFDCAESWKELNYHPKYSNQEMLIESYTSYLDYYNHSKKNNISYHQKIPGGLIINILTYVLRLVALHQNQRRKN
jgi:nucleoside-diphosphate-sugar epimerase